MNRPTVVFFGNEQLAQGLERAVTPTFEALLGAEYKILALVLPSENTKKPLKITEIAAAHGVPVFYTKNSREIMELIVDKKPDVGVLASFGKIIPGAIIDAIPLGILNIHPSLLPKYRGTTPIESAILNDDKTTGVSVMGLVREMDAGPILAQKEVALDGTETKQELYESLAKVGAELLIGTLREITEKAATPVAQDEAQATFTRMLFKKDGIIEPEKYTATEIERQIRAYAGFPKSKYEFFGIPCTVTCGHVGATIETELDVRCKDGNYLCVDRLIPAGRKEMAAADFLRGRAR